MFCEEVHGRQLDQQLKPLRLSSGYWYVATPYAKYEGGHDAAFTDAVESAARLINAGVNVMSPISHSHPIAKTGLLDANDHDLWLPLDEQFMAGAHGLIVVEMPGWHESKGVQHEIEWFKARGRPVEHLTYPELRPIL